MRVVTVVGARPQFVKAAVVSHALQEAGIEEMLIHTGQHYDDAMSRVFFDELGIPEPHVNLEVGSGTHAIQTGETMIRLEAELLRMDDPDWVVVYGDTNATLAGALVAAKLHLPLAHIEAGLRSFNRRMPEEINRVVTDHLADLCFCPTPTAVHNLQVEGVTEGVHLTGDVMYDATLAFARRAEERVPLESLVAHAPGAYMVATIHRAENTDDPARLAGIFEGLGCVGMPVVLPLHPRTRTRLGSIRIPSNVEVTNPLGYLAMLRIVRSARCVLTDSGGLQKEALWLGVPCVTLRDETEWVETLEGGWNRLAGADPNRIVALANTPPETAQPVVSDPGAASRITEILSRMQG